MTDFLSAIPSPYGMVLVTGPTGSGKTTTLYSALSRDQPARGQHHDRRGPRRVQPRRASTRSSSTRRIGLTFAAALKRVPAPGPEHHHGRRDPRHRTRRRSRSRRRSPATWCSPRCTRTTRPSAIGRLIDMGIEPFLVASSVNLILAQRLVRKVCAACRKRIELHRRGAAELQLDEQDAEGATFVQGEGCVDCNNTGYRGRAGVYEVMHVSPAVRDMILDRASATDIKTPAVKEGMLTLRRDALDEAQERRHVGGRGPEGDRVGRSVVPAVIRERTEHGRSDPATAARRDGRDARRRTCTSRPGCRRSSASTAR